MALIDYTIHVYTVSYKLYVLYIQSHCSFLIKLLYKPHNSLHRQPGCSFIIVIAESLELSKESTLSG